jgi:hypothetical protein
VIVFAIGKGVVNEPGRAAAGWSRRADPRASRNEEERMAKQATASEVSTAGKKRKRTVPAAQVVVSAAERPVHELSHHEIAEHAYGLYLARGAHEGGAESDWFCAEQALRARR